MNVIVQLPASHALSAAIDARARISEVDLRRPATQQQQQMMKRMHVYSAVNGARSVSLSGTRFLIGMRLDLAHQQATHPRLLPETEMSHGPSER